MAHLDDLYNLGQSTWLNYLRRAFIESGELKQAIQFGISGITSMPLIFEKAITSSSDYDKAIRDLVAQGKPVRSIYEFLVADDIQRAADVLHPVFEMSSGLEGYVTLELDPSLAHDAVGTVAEARHVLHEVNRPNAMIEIPATDAGIQALEALIHDGINVNATHIFSLDTYQKVAEAYLRGIERYIESHSVWRQNPVSVASFSLSVIDRAVDRLLDGYDRPDLKKKTAITLAKKAYGIFLQLYSGNVWHALKRRDAVPQRLKWTRTTPLNYDYPENHYVEALIGPDTVATMSQATLTAFRNHGKATPTLLSEPDMVEYHLTEIQRLGIDLEQLGHELQIKSLSAFEVYFQSMIDSVMSKRDKLDREWQRYESRLGLMKDVYKRAMEPVCQEDVVCRIWSGDHTLWKPQPQEITNRIGWLHSIEIMRENIGRLEEFAQSLHLDTRGEGPVTDVVVLGMGGSSLAAELFGTVFARWRRPLAGADIPPSLSILDTTCPDVIAELAARLNLRRTLFVVSSKSGGTVETISAFNYFYNLVTAEVGERQAGGHFVAVTDPDTSLAHLAKRLEFRDIFLNDPNIGGRFSALSFFGLVPAAAAGVDLRRLLDSALSMAVNAHSCNCPTDGDNIAAQFGIALGSFAVEGRDKLTIITSPAVAQFADWAEQLIAESTGKEGKGILPVVGEPLGEPDGYGDDRFFVYIRLEGDRSRDQGVNALVDAGLPVVTFNLKDVYDLGGLFFTWEMATAIAGAMLGINPFDQPNVEEAKIQARELIDQYRDSGSLPSGDLQPPSVAALSSLLAQARAGDYLAMQAYLAPTDSTNAALESLRAAIKGRHRLATTIGYGPRYLHSTGQLHKGDRGKGLFILLTADAITDIPVPTTAGSAESDITFGVLHQAQALGDGHALRKARRRIVQIHLGTEIASGLDTLLQGLVDGDGTAGK